MILESLKQLVSDSPSTKSICRIIFITNDGPLNKAASSIVKPNLYIYLNIDEFKSLINILNSEITEELINLIKDDAEKLFFEKENVSTLFFSGNIKKQIQEQFSKELNIKQEGADARENGTWWITKPGFEKKIKQQVYWKSIISVDFTNYKTSVRFIQNQPNTFSGLTGQTIGLGANLSSGLGSGLLSGLSSLTSQNSPQLTTSRDKIDEGKTRFEVLWSVTLMTGHKLKNAKVEFIKYLDTEYS